MKIIWLHTDAAGQPLLSMGEHSFTPTPGSTFAADARRLVTETVEPAHDMARASGALAAYAGGSVWLRFRNEAEISPAIRAYLADALLPQPAHTHPIVLTRPASLQF